MTVVETVFYDQPSDSLSEMAYRRIEDMIVTRILPPGSMISEHRLSEDLKCGRTPIREALQRLKLEGFVEIHARRGALVSPVDVTKQLELLEVRRPIEDLVVRLASERATKTEKVELAKLASEILDAAKVGDRPRYLKANRAIHEMRVRAAHNSMLSKTSGMINGLSRRFWYSYIEDTDSFNEAARLHSDILLAIVSGDADRGSAAVSALLDFLERLTRRAIETKFW